MIDLCFEGDDGALEGEVIEFELQLELTSFEWGGLRACHEDAPDSVWDPIDNVSSEYKNTYSAVSSPASLFNLGIMASICINIKDIFDR